MHSNVYVPHYSISPSTSLSTSLPHYFANGIWFIRVPNCTQTRSARNHTFAWVAVTHFSHYFAVNCVQFQRKPNNRPLLHVCCALSHPEVFMHVCVCSDRIGRAYIVCQFHFRHWHRFRLDVVRDIGIAFVHHCSVHGAQINLQLSDWAMTYANTSVIKRNHCIHWIHIHTCVCVCVWACECWHRPNDLGTIELIAILRTQVGRRTHYTQISRTQIRRGKSLRSVLVFHSVSFDVARPNCYFHWKTVFEFHSILIADCR